MIHEINGLKLIEYPGDLYGITVNGAPVTVALPWNEAVSHYARIAVAGCVNVAAMADVVGQISKLTKPERIAMSTRSDYATIQLRDTKGRRIQSVTRNIRSIINNKGIAKIYGADTAVYLSNGVWYANLTRPEIRNAMRSKHT